MTDINMRLLDAYHDEFDPPGTEPGEECGRYPEPDEDTPRGYRPHPCTGTMVVDDDTVICDTCYKGTDQ